MSSKDSKMGLGLLVGMIVGAIGGLFLAPKSGKENRDAVVKKVTEMKELVESGEIKDRVQEIFGDLSDESVRVYNNARESIMDGIEELKTMTPEDYAKVVQETVDNVKDGSKVGSDKLMKLKNQLLKDMPFMKQEVEKRKKKRTGTKDSAKLMASKKE